VDVQHQPHLTEGLVEEPLRERADFSVADFDFFIFVDKTAHRGHDCRRPRAKRLTQAAIRSRSDDFVDSDEALLNWNLPVMRELEDLPALPPQSEWVDLDIDRENPQGQAEMRWNSGYTVKGRVDAPARIWYGAMRIPFSAIDTRPPQKGRELRIGLYRIAGVNPSRRFYAWRPTGQTSFHVPQAFGTLRLK
jgi:hypothetical protein